MSAIAGVKGKILKGGFRVKVDRLVSILMTLLEKERISAQELADRFEVSQRTIYRDIEALSMAGIPVCSISGAGGGFEILPEYKVDKQVFSKNELSALLMGLTNLSGMVQGEDFTYALAKVRSFIPVDQAKDIEIKANQICIDLNPWMGNGNMKRSLEIVKTALQEHRLLSFTYTDGHGSQTERIAEPYQLVLKSGHWYFQGYCRSRNDYRLFRLSRMTDLQMLQETYSPRDYEKPVLDFEPILEALQTDIKIRIHKSVLDRVLEFCTLDRITPDGEEYYLVNYPFIEREYYYDMLLSFGDKCECLEPAHVRAEVKRRIQSMADLYRKRETQA